MDFQEAVDVSNCDREPIHLLGRVQEVGFLVAVTSDWLVSNLSANINNFVDVDPEALIGCPVYDLVDRHTIHQIRNRLQHLGSDSLPEVVANIEVAHAKNKQLFDVTVHISGKKVILEFEPTLSPEVTDRHLAAVQQAIQRIADLPDVDSILKFVTRFCAALSQFDRVMAYVFRSDDSGEVKAETHAIGMEPFLGLRYPASDIPKQARALYVRSPVRSIANSKNPGAPIIPGAVDDSEQIDLSNSILRSVSSIHLEYLQNMGVAASLSLSIVVEGKLWGLIACHHRQPKHLPQVQRNALVLFAQMLSLVIGSKIAAEEKTYTSSAGELINNFSRAAATSKDLVAVLMEQRDTLMKLMSAEGLAVVNDGFVEVAGSAPSVECIRLLTKRLNTLPAGEIFSTSELSAFLPEFSDFVSRAAGILSIPISKTPRDYIMFFRPEVVKRVNWAGNPDKPVTFGPKGSRLTPRKSFEVWRSLVEGQSEEWKAQEIAVAEQFRITVLEVVLQMADEAASDRKKAAAKQELLIAELNHRVRNILNLVRSLISQSSQNENSVSDFAKVLESRVHALARAHDQITKSNWSSASLKELVKTEAEAYLFNKSSRLQISGPDVEVTPAAYSTLALVMHEMITNSAKYGSLSDSRGRIEMDIGILDDDSLNISWRELDGPAVKAPTRRGFGSAITETSIPFELNGESVIDYDLTGVKARFWVPANHVSKVHANIQEQEGLIPEEEVSVDDTANLQEFPSRILLVEDNMIIAVDTESVLISLGASFVKICSNVATSILAIDDAHFDFAVLDMNLGNETSMEVARKLSDLDIPFVFASGYGDALPLDEFGGKVRVITKPFDKDTLKKMVLSTLLSHRANK